jgi:hypothetical protein
MGKLTIANPAYDISLHRDGKQIGKLDFSGDEMVLIGDVDESAKVFFDYLASCFRGRLEEERAKEREACAKLIETSCHDDMTRAEEAEAIRGRTE